MKRSWLVQRLNAPHQAIEAFSFGGGLRNGGLSDEAMGLLRGVFSFDYMGAAEFEWGAVPEALQTIARSKKLTAFSVVIPVKSVPAPWRGEKEAPTTDPTVYVICPSEFTDEVVERVEAFAAGQAQTKERVGLSEVLRPGEYVPRTRGWLELDNGYFFFADEAMWHSTCELFGVSA